MNRALEESENLEISMKLNEDALRLKYEHEEKLYIERMAERRKLYFLSMLFFFAFSILLVVSVSNPGIFQIDKEIFYFINQALNAIVLLMIPFILGGLGGVARVLMSGLGFMRHLTLIVSSGLMSMFSWVAIKSGIFLSIVAPHLEKNGLEVNVASDAPSNFYTMALVAIFVGMFSTNLYLFINQRVEQLTLQKNESSKS